MKKIFTLAAFLCACSNLFAFKQVVTVQNTFFSPSSFAINLGDTVQWTWINGSHTTTSLSVPAGASSWDKAINSSSTTFIYVPTDTGMYAYKCTPHFGFGMMATFDVICPQVTVTISAGSSTTFCSGNSVTLTSSTTGNPSSYQWRKNGVPLSGMTNASYVASSTGSYSVITTNGCGSSATSNSISVTVNPLPSATITPSGPTTFCSGGSVVLNAPVTANRNYKWKKGTNLISGATLSSYTVTTGGNYKVIVTNTITGCSKTTSSAIVVTVNAIPTATITPQGPTTFCPGDSVVLKANSGTGLSYQWTKGGNNIGGATHQNYTAKSGGNYKVIVTNSSSCSKISAVVTVTINCRNEKDIVQGNQLRVYPNPSNGLFRISVKTDITADLNFYVKDFRGAVVFNSKVVAEESAFGENLKPGIYFIELRKGKELIAGTKIIKINP